MHPRLLEGLEHFNSLRFWEAHESWEEIWRVAEGDERQFLQGLIQLAAAYHHVQRGTPRGAGRLFDSALRRLNALPPSYGGIDRCDAAASAARDRVATASSGDETAVFKLIDFPKLKICASLLHD